MKYKDWLKSWLENYVKIASKHRTYMNYSECVANHIEPNLGKYDINELTPFEIQRFITKLTESGNLKTREGLSPSTVNEIITIIQNSLETAYIVGKLKEYPAHSIKRPNKILKSLAALTKNCLTDFEIEKVVCDYLIKNTNYEINNTYNQNAATVLVKNKGQCSGIARAVKYIFDYFDIECLKIDGTAGEAGTYGPHSWNIVKIDGEYYHLDVTCMIGANMSKSQPFRYAYLNYSDTQIATNHTWERDKYPKCNVDSPIKTTQTKTTSTSTYANGSQSTGRVTPDKTIYSYGEFKREIGVVYDNNGTRLFFLSKIPVKDSQELIDTLLKEAINEARVRNIGVSVNISSINSDITVSIERK